MFSSPKKYAPGEIIECLKLKICTNNRVVKSLYDKVINIDIKSILLPKPLAKLEKDDILRVNAQIHGLSYILECKLFENIVRKAEPFNFDSLEQHTDDIDFSFITSAANNIDDQPPKLNEECYPKRSSNSSGSNFSAFGSNILPSLTMTVDEITSQKLDKLLIQNENILQHLSELNRKQDFLINQNEKIIEQQTQYNISVSNMNLFENEDLTTSFNNRDRSSLQREISTSSLRSASGHEIESGSKLANHRQKRNSNLFKKESTASNINLSENSEENSVHFDPDYNSDDEEGVNNEPCTSRASIYGGNNMKKKSFESTQKEFNRKVKASLAMYIPAEDQQLGMPELTDKYPDKVNLIKGSLRHFLPRGTTFTIAWSKALHSIRQAKYIERRKK